MKQIAVMTIVLGLSVSPVVAQDDPVPEVEEGFSLMEEGARMLMRGLMTEMKPAIGELRETFEQMGPAFAEFAQSVGPAFADLLNQVDDLRNYGAPEFMPNGDIIIRRKPDAPFWQPDVEPDQDMGEIEL